MAMREFIVSDAEAARHIWLRWRGAKLECASCRAIAEIRDGTYYLLYGGAGCGLAVKALQTTAPQEGRGIAVHVQNDRSVRVDFAVGSDPAYIAAVIAALQKLAS